MANESNHPGGSGGFRENSANLHTFKVKRKFTCEWCGSDFESIQKTSKFCCDQHRVRGNRIDNRIRKRRRLMDKDRTGHKVRAMSQLKINKIEEE